MQLSLLLFVAMTVSSQLGALENARMPLGVPFGIEGTPEWKIDSTWRIAGELGLRLRTFQMRWLETEPGKYSWSESPTEDDFLKRLRELKSRGFTVSVDYTNVFMDHKHLPGYLEGKSLDDAYLLDRWEAHLEAFLERYGESIDLLSFGLEVDTYFAKHPNEWKAFLVYFRRGVAVARRLRPKIRLSVTLQSGGLDRFWKDLSADCDFLSTTYYAPCSAFGKSPTSEALEPSHPRYFRLTLDRILQVAGKKKVLLREVGCPSHEAVDSSPEIQAKFVHALFDWLRDHEESLIGVSWVGRIDWPWEHTKTALKGQLDDALLRDGPFLHFLTSLGLQYENGMEKPAFKALRDELKNPRAAKETKREEPPAHAWRDPSIEGAWRVMSAEFSGADYSSLRGAKLVLGVGTKSFLLPDGTVENGSYEVAVGEPVHRIDATTEGRAGTALGIYKVEGKKLKMCFSQSGAARPTTFETRRGDDHILLVLEPVERQ